MDSKLNKVTSERCDLTEFISSLSVSEHYPILEALTARSETFESQLAQSCREVCKKNLPKYPVSKSAFEALIPNWPT